MLNNLKKLFDVIKADSKYVYLKNLSEDKYVSFLEKEYFKNTGEKLDIIEPKKYTEKMQYAKLYLNTPLMTKLTDKYAVRDWVKEKIGSEYLIPLLGVWDDFSEIDFNELPNQFVLKLNSGSGTNVVVENKQQFNYRKAKLRFSRWRKKNFAFSADIQPHYKDIQHKIIAEKYIEDRNGELNDYKFLCFNGEVYYCWIDVGRFSNHYRNVYNLQWELQPWQQHYYANTPYDVEKPENFEKMIEIAKKLCQGFSQVRVDLYNVDGRIFFGEMTFTNGSGYELIRPEKYNYMLGDLWDYEKNI